jgi:hypothetical protein
MLNSFEIRKLRKKKIFFGNRNTYRRLLKNKEAFRIEIKKISNKFKRREFSVSLPERRKTKE